MIFGDRFDVSLQLMLCGKQNVAEMISSFICSLPPDIISDIRRASSNNDENLELERERKFSNGVVYVYSCSISDNKLTISVSKSNDSKRKLDQTVLKINAVDKDTVDKLDEINLGFVSFMDGTQTLRDEGAPVIDFIFKRKPLFNRIILKYNDNATRRSLISNKLVEESISPVSIDELKHSGRPRRHIRRKSKKSLFH